MTTALDFNALRTGLRGPLVAPADADYDTLRKVWNGMIDRRPAVIVRCSGAADVIAAVKYGANYGTEGR